MDDFYQSYYVILFQFFFNKIKILYVIFWYNLSFKKKKQISR